MELRRWQKECSTLAVCNYRNRKTNFFCLATPGAGKSIMAAEVASHLLKNNEIDFILCFSPSKSISTGLEKTFSSYLSRSFNGLLGSVGRSLTYQSMLHLSDEFWEIIANNRVLVVFDEIHHCEGESLTHSNSWGFKILQKIKKQASYTLSLSGTPWRSNNAPIVLGKYIDPDYALECDYIYGFKQAIADRVCRTPTVVLMDNDNITVTNSNKVKTKYRSLKEMLSESEHSYQAILHSQFALREILIRAIKKLNKIRLENQDAAGLIVASSVTHAQRICQILNNLGEPTIMVTYKDNNAAKTISEFRNGAEKWIVSIGMVSEGTDIPRLQVCCHLSRVKTELYFRQVLGRILRTNSAVNQEAWLYTFAEANLTEFSYRLEEEIPNSNIVVKQSVEVTSTDVLDDIDNSNTIKTNQLDEAFGDVFFDFSCGEEKESSNNGMLNKFCTQTPLEFVGNFREQVIASFISPF